MHYHVGAGGHRHRLAGMPPVAAATVPLPHERALDDDIHIRGSIDGMSCARLEPRTASGWLDTWTIDPG